MLDQLTSIVKIPELRKRILFTLGAIAIFRAGTHIPIPGISTQALQSLFEGGGGNILQYLNMFTGGALGRGTLFGLGITPYINASIIMSLLTAVVPKLKELQQQGREGKKVITKYTRYGTLAIAFIQSYGWSFFLVRQGMVEGSVVLFFVTSVLSMTTGTVFLMWLGERITENGIGNGISVLIMTGIMARFPSQLYSTWVEVNYGSVSPLWGLILVAVFIVVIAGVVIVQQGRRKIRIQYAKRTAGRKVYGGHTSHLPIKVNQGGVIPIIFASVLLSLPMTLAQWAPGLSWMTQYVQRGSIPYLVAYVLLIIFFTYFYSSIIFDPNDVANNLKESGGFIPGVRPGESTVDYISSILNRLLLVGAMFLGAIAVLPYVFTAISGLTSFWLGGTSVLIVVGVGLDVLMQIESHMVMRHYDSLTEAGGSAILGRRS
ncbi:preprotein translocase subunit SecY [Candidatus Bipolaricaulota bacterium]|nr:preprotein translocase subunit SecY [Candidatus Bipolaricaulota bacterium]